MTWKWLQGDLERQRGLPGSTMCQPVPTPAMPQLRFIRMFLEPTLAACKPLAPAFMEMACESLARSVSEWEAILARDGPAQCASQSGKGDGDDASARERRAEGRERSGTQSADGAAERRSQSGGDGALRDDDALSSGHSQPGTRTYRASLSNKSSSGPLASTSGPLDALGSAPSGFFGYQLHSTTAAASLSLNELPDHAPAQPDPAAPRRFTVSQSNSRNDSRNNSHNNSHNNSRASSQRAERPK